MRVIVFGSRNWPELYHFHIAKRLSELPRDVVIVHGDCKTGADFYADSIAATYSIRVERHPAIWYPIPGGPMDRSAGPRRNAHMASLGADLAIGFRAPGKSNGTDNMADECELRGIPVERNGWDWRKSARFRS